MSIALSTVLLVLAILPGIAAWSSFYSGKFPRQFAQASPVTELARFFACALLVDAAALRVLHPTITNDEFLLGLALAAGKPLTLEQSRDCASIAAHWQHLVAGYLLVVLAAGIVGFLLRRLTWALRLDLVVHFVRIKHEWYYLLQGRLPGLPRGAVQPWADVMVQHTGDEGMRLYSGIVESFEVTGDGGLRELSLSHASRGKGRGEDFRWAEIPGARLILSGSGIRSINMQYLATDPPNDRRDRQKLLLTRFLRSVLFEEP